MRHALIKDGKVINVILWDRVAEWSPPQGYTVINCTNGRCDIGDQWDDQNQKFIYADRTAK